MNTIAWTPKAAKQLLKLDRLVQRRIRDAVDGLACFPETSNVKRLTNHECGYRLRVGDYRVVFNFDGAGWPRRRPGVGVAQRQMGAPFASPQVAAPIVFGNNQGTS